MTIFNSIKVVAISFLAYASVQLAASGQDMAATYINAAQQLEAAAAQTTDPQQRASDLQQAQQYRNMAAQLGTANSSSPSAFASPNGSSAALDSLARQQAQLRQLQQQQQEAQARLQAINAANQRIQNLNNARDSINGSIGTVGNFILQQMQQSQANDEQTRLEQQQQQKEERMERQQRAIEKQIEDQQEEIEAFKNRQPISFDDQSAPPTASGTFSSLLDTPEAPVASPDANTSVSQNLNPAPDETSSLANSLFGDNVPPNQPSSVAAQSAQQESAVMNGLLGGSSAAASIPTDKDNFNQSVQKVSGELLDSTAPDGSADLATSVFLKWLKQQPVSNGKSWNDLSDDDRDSMAIFGSAIDHGGSMAKAGLSLLSGNFKSAWDNAVKSYQSGIDVMNKALAPIDKVTQPLDEQPQQ